MNEIVNWILWVIGLCAVIVTAIVGIAWFIFWITAIVNESRRQKSDIADRMFQCHRWFAGWKDLDIIWDYIKDGNGDIANVRGKYARARGTNEYGVPRDQ